MKPDYAEIGRRIARRRKQLNLTQEFLAELTDVTPQYISHIEHARSIPSTEVIMRLAIVLDTTPDEFLVGTARYEDQRWRRRTPAGDVGRAAGPDGGLCGLGIGAEGVKRTCGFFLLFPPE